MQNLLALLGLSEQHPQVDPRLAITCMKMTGAQGATDLLHERLQSMPLNTAADMADFQSTLADYAAFMQYAAMLRKQLDQAGVQESEYKSLRDTCFTTSPAQNVLDEAVL